MKNLNEYIPKKCICELDQFKARLAAFAEETGEEAPMLFDEGNILLRIANIRTENGVLRWDEWGYGFTKEGYVEIKREEYLEIVDFRDASDVWFNDNEFNQQLDCWNKCLSKAKRYREMSKGKGGLEKC